MSLKKSILFSAFIKNYLLKYPFLKHIYIYSLTQNDKQEKR